MASLPRTSRTTLSSLRRMALVGQRRTLASHAPDTSSDSTSTPSSSSASSSSSSSSSPSPPANWSPAVKPGVSPAYDAALRFLSEQSAHVKRQLNQVQSDPASILHQLDAAGKQEYLDSLTVASEVNDPALRWSFVNTHDDDLDMSNPTICHLRERAWRRCGPLEKLSERVKDQAVVPDSIGYIAPTVDVQVLLRDSKGPGIGDHADRESSDLAGDILPGVLVEQKNLMQEPLLRLTAFHPEEKMYTLIMVDLDNPTRDGKLDTWLHWLVTDIPLSSKTTRLCTPASKLGREVARYDPPVPAQGSKRHRYVTLLFEQSDTAPAVEDDNHGKIRPQFPLRDFVQKHALEPAGIHFFRCEWTPHSQKTITSAWHRSRGRSDEEQWGNISRKERRDWKGDVKRRNVAEQHHLEQRRLMLEEAEQRAVWDVEESDLSPEEQKETLLEVRQYYKEGRLDMGMRLKRSGGKVI